MSKENSTQAAANKAAEEGGLLARISQLIFDNTSLGWDKAIDLATAVLVFVDADRAAHPVGNNAEVDLPDYKIYAVINSMGWSLEDSAKDELFSLCKRVLRKVANKAEVEPVAHLYKWIGDASDSYEGRVIARSVAELKGEIDMYPDSWERIGPLYATPPATTGASTVLTDERTAALIEARDAVSEMRNHLEAFGQYGVETARAALDGAVDTIDELIGDVAAQAGQVALPGWINVDERLPENGKDVIILYWPYNNHENERVAGTAHHVEGTFYDEDGNDMHPPSHWMPFVIPAAAPSPAKESK